MNSNTQATTDALGRINERAEYQHQVMLLKQLQLPLWSDAQRGVPNGLLRSALFGAIGKGKESYKSREKLASVDGTSIVYTGIRLSQHHLTLWESLVHIAREQQLGNRCAMTTYQLLKVMRKTDTGSARATLYRMLANLQATAIEVTQGRMTYTGSLIEEGFRDDHEKRIVIVLNRKLVALFQGDQFTRVSSDIRHDLKRPLAMWLHGFYSTHARPLPYNITTIYELCGSEDKSIKSFSESLVKALAELAVVSAKHGKHFAYWTTKSKLYVTHDPAVRLGAVDNLTS